MTSSWSTLKCTDYLITKHTDHPRIFCCGNADSIGSKLLSRLPGQAVQIITESPNGNHDQEEIKAKKFKKSGPEMV